ncbi:MAG: putative glycoside hydrolase [Planctomycetota bacterium]
MFRKLFCAALCGSVLLASIAFLAAANGAEKLLCEWKENPTAVGDRCPEFSWETKSQSAYRIIVSGPALAGIFTFGDLWDSSKVTTPLPIAEYAGKPLQDGKTYSWRVQVWDADGNPGPWSAAQRFTTKFWQPPSHLPHIRTFLNFGSKPELIASRYDITFRQDAKPFRPEIITINYSLLATMVIPSDKEKELAAYCVKTGLTTSGVHEDMFIHFREDHPVTLHVGSESPTSPIEKRIVPGWEPANDRNDDGIVDNEEFKNRANPKAAARKKSEARVPIYFWGPPRDDYVMNPGSEMFQRYLAEVYIQERIKGYDGLFIDTTTPVIPGSGHSGEILEYPRKTPVEQDAWLRAMQTMLARIKIAIGDKIFTANCWHSTPFVLDGTEWENWLNISRSPSQVRAQLDEVIDIDRRGKVQLVQYNPIYHPDTNGFGVKVPVDPDRDRIYGLALYYLANGDYTYFGFGQHGYAKSEEKYFPAIEYDIGKAMGPYFVLDSAKSDLRGANLLKNGDFEQDADGDGNTDEWIVAEPVETATDHKRSGQRSAKIASDSTTINNINKQLVTLKPNTAYTLCGWIRTEGIGNRAAAQVYPYDFDGTVTSFLTAGGTQDWTFCSQVFKTAADPTGRICFRIFNSTGTAWFDDIRLVEGAFFKWEVLARRYEKALVLVKPSVCPMYGDETATTHELDGVYAPLRADGTLGPPARTVSLRNAEAAILIRQK